MAKRAATSQLNHDNWDDDEETEPAGTFKPLVGDELKKRIIKKAKRSLGNKEETSSASSPFAAFSGFSSGSSTVSPFSFLKKNNDSGESNIKLNVIPQGSSKKENGSNSANSGEEMKRSGVEENSTKSLSDSFKKLKPYRSIDYYRHLQSLNESVLNWMQLHLSKNKCCDFTPVFNDYKKHLDTLNVTYPVKQKGIEDEVSEKSTATENVADTEKSSNVNHEFKFENSVKNDDETDYGAHFSSNTTNTSTFSFGMKKTPSATSSLSTGISTTSFREEPIPENKPFQFSFGLKKTQDLSKSFSFASVDKTGDSENAVEEEYIPPKNDFIAVKEEDAFYSKRCKLFFKKDDGFVDKGVGILHLKPLDGKTQLLIRADTSLGNILLNIVLSASLPMSRTGKNNVLLVCVPNPPLEVKNDNEDKEASAIPMLIRVKTSEDANELLETLNKHKS